MSADHFWIRWGWKKRLTTEQQIHCAMFYLEKQEHIFTYPIRRLRLNGRTDPVAARQWSADGNHLQNCVRGLEKICRSEDKLWEKIARHPETSTELLMEMSKFLAPDEKLLIICVRSLGKRARKTIWLHRPS